jgi:hypothetical protein
MATKQLTTTKERVNNIEEEVDCINKKLDRIIEALNLNQPPAGTILQPGNYWEDPIISEGPRILRAQNEPVLFKKPIMYLYNMTGTTVPVTVDFGSIVIPDAIPEIREDGKITFNLDSDSYIDNKYKYLYYEIAYDKPLPKAALSIYISNDKFLSEGLANLARLCGLWSDEIADFVTYWDLELKRSDCKYWKCDILTEKELDPILPITVFPRPEFFIRRYIKFSESDKGQKISSKTSKDIRLTTPMRTGKLRVCEWGGMINESGTIM